mmetsp:Transcript_6152/g.10929  ORF Transcript_6152/g.10929 Transcript_6152/m.10929 type:complete len:213 (+) Transcript_6152:150-788(+)
MCKNCLKEVLPDRHTTCLDDGVYLLNWKACAQCGSTAPPVARNKSFEEEEEEESLEDEGGLFAEGSMRSEETTFHHACASCDHAVSEHYHKYLVQGSSKQEYIMSCALCGKGAYNSDFSDIVYAAATTTEESVPTTDQASTNPATCPASNFNIPSQDGPESSNEIQGTEGALAIGQQGLLNLAKALEQTSFQGKEGSEELESGNDVDEDEWE